MRKILEWVAHWIFNKISNALLIQKAVSQCLWLEKWAWRWRPQNSKRQNLHSKGEKMSQYPHGLVPDGLPCDKCGESHAGNFFVSSSDGTGNDLLCRPCAKDRGYDFRQHDLDAATEKGHQIAFLIEQEEVCGMIFSCLFWLRKIPIFGKKIVSDRMFIRAINDFGEAAKKRTVAQEELELLLAEVKNDF